MPLIALTRAMSPRFAACELTHLDRVPIDVDLARRQHAEYEQRLVEAGCTLVRAAPAPDLPDSVFVEDVALVFDEVAVLTHPGARSRRGETTGVAEALARWRPLRHIEPPATIDGGDVLVVGRRVFVGQSSRTNQAAVEQLRTMLDPLGYTVQWVTVTGCLHLKSAVTAIDDETLLVNPASIGCDAFSGYRLVEVHPDEPSAANVLRVGGSLIYPRGFPRTAQRLEAVGIPMMLVDVSEIAKAEGAVTCCSLVWRS